MSVAAAAVATAALTLFGVGPAHGAGRDAAAPPASRVGSSPAAEAALTAFQARIARYVQTHGTRYTFSDYLDPSTGQIVLQTNAPAAVVASLTDLPGAAPAQRAAAGQVRVRPGAMSSTFNRRDDIEFYRGGAGITAAGAICSSGYSVTNSAGSTLMITAGHCFPVGFAVLTEAGRTYGTLIERHLPLLDATDVGILGQRPYWGAVYVGGPTSFLSIPVIGTSVPGIGLGGGTHCFSGRTSGEQCGFQVLSNTAQVCTELGCSSPVISFAGTPNPPQPGDSGAPFYQRATSPSGEFGALIHGHVIARCSCGIGYAVPWSVVQPMMGGLTIRTS
jgi:hypothetical protein